MYSIYLPLTCDTSVCSLYPNANFSKYNNLIAMSDDCDDIRKILFKIPKTLLHILDNNEIISAKLSFNGTASNPWLNQTKIFQNNSDYNYNKVTWNTCPDKGSLLSNNYWNFNPYDNCVECDISNIISKITTPESLEFGFQIIIKSMNSWLKLSSSRTICQPNLILKLNPRNLCNNYLLAYVNNTSINQSISIPTGKVIPFNVVNTSKSLELNNQTSEISIKQPGCYTIDWWLDYSGGIAMDRITLSLKSSNSIIYSSSCPVNSPGFFSGHAIIKVISDETDKNYNIALYNTSVPLNHEDDAGKLYLSPISMPASIRVIKIE
ncbi:MAG: DNRLRE domain-containing protein [Clostridium sp.]|nr:DNRLRE domain-containing protein [Clostridium sp.]MDU7084644.1 DNRLRE domain-containing protein [Clostridium sp.]